MLCQALFSQRLLVAYAPRFSSCIKYFILDRKLILVDFRHCMEATLLTMFVCSKKSLKTFITTVLIGNVFHSSASFDAGLADLPFTISPVCIRIIAYILIVFVQFEIYFARLCVIGVSLLLYHSLLYGCVSQGLGTTEFTNLIG